MGCVYELSTALHSQSGAIINVKVLCDASSFRGETRSFPTKTRDAAIGGLLLTRREPIPPEVPEVGRDVRQRKLRKLTQSRSICRPSALFYSPSPTQERCRLRASSPPAMPLRTPALTFPPTATLQCLPTPGSSTSSSPHACARGTRPRQCERAHYFRISSHGAYGAKRRAYATLAGHHNSHNDTDEASDHHTKPPPPHHWPTAPTGHIHPTPYQILNLPPKAPYTKSHFYALVKLYHPDLSSAPPANIPRTTKLDRYRLIVAAHAILSDPTKRSAYDRLGAGWAGRQDLRGSAPSTDRPGPFTPGYAGAEDPSIWRNATWEDWERFYARRAREASSASGAPQPNRPLYMQNSSFILLVLLLALMGSSANYSRAQDAGSLLVEQRDIVHDRAAKELRRVRREVSGVEGGREERIRWFLRNREAALGGLERGELEELREERGRRVLAEGEVCGVGSDEDGRGG